MGYLKVFLALLVAMLFDAAISGKYPKDLPRCKSGDNDCFPRVITEVLRRTKNGNAEMNLPPTDPLHIPQVNIIQDKSSTIAIELYFKDCDFYGISNAVINKTVGFEKIAKGSKYEVHARIPQIRMIAKYKIDGKVLILPITGSGRSNLTLDNVDIKIKFLPNITEKNGKQHLQIPSNKFKLVFETSRLYLQLENLFNGNKALGDNMNLFLNENWQIILEELKPAVRETLAQILSGVINAVFDRLPYNDLFTDTDDSK